jgi:hypothetical protein
MIVDGAPEPTTFKPVGLNFKPCVPFAIAAANGPSGPAWKD